MHKFRENIRNIDLKTTTLRHEEHLMLLIDCFSDRVDGAMQNSLICDLMARYSEVSRMLEETNRYLNSYNDRLESLVEEKANEILASKIATIRALVKSAESRDDETGSHIERTSCYCKILAEKLREAGIYKEACDSMFAANMETASPLHDIGKVGIPDVILLKPGRLTESEFEIMKTHTAKGYETLASVEKLYPDNGYLKFGMEISRYHHEKWNGSGYGGRLKGEEIPLSARIMALSDVYDALRSKRVYKDAFTHEKTMEIIKEGRGVHFDPRLSDLFVRYQGLFEEVYETQSD